MNEHDKLKLLLEQAAQKYLAQAGTSGKLLHDFNQSFEKTLISLTLKHYNNNHSQAASALGISRTTLYKKIQTLAV